MRRDNTDDSEEFHDSVAGRANRAEPAQQIKMEVACVKNENDIAFEAWFKSHTKGIVTTFTHAHWAKKGWDARSEKMNRAASTNTPHEAITLWREYFEALNKNEVAAFLFCNAKRIDAVLA